MTFGRSQDLHLNFDQSGMVTSVMLNSGGEGQLYLTVQCGREGRELEFDGVRC